MTVNRVVELVPGRLFWPREGAFDGRLALCLWVIKDDSTFHVGYLTTDGELRDVVWRADKEIAFRW